MQLTQLYSPSPPKKPRSKSSPAATPSRVPSAPLSSPLVFSSVEEAIQAQISGPPDIVRTVRGNPRIGFFYMSSDVPVSSPKYDAFNLR